MKPLIMSPMTRELSTLNSVKIPPSNIRGRRIPRCSSILSGSRLFAPSETPGALYLARRNRLWAHRGNYLSISQPHTSTSNQTLRILWKTLQSMPEYHESTTLGIGYRLWPGNGKVMDETLELMSKALKTFGRLTGFPILPLLVCERMFLYSRRDSWLPL